VDGVADCGKIMLNEFGRRSKEDLWTYVGNRQWRIGYSHEICNLCKEMELARNISLRRLHWVGHVIRMKDDRVLKKALKE